MMARLGPRMDSSIFRELKGMLLSGSSLPKASQLPSVRMRKELSSFLKGFSAGSRMDFTTNDLLLFIDKHALFHTLDFYLREFKRRKELLVIIEGGDATGKTALAKRLAKDLNGVVITNQSGLLFNKMFGFPKSYKGTVVDYGRNRNVVFLYYFLQNIYALERLLELSKNKKVAVLDAFVMRTMASHRTHPSFSKGGAGRMVSTGDLKTVIDGKLNPAAIKILDRNRGAIFFLFLYSSERSRQEQARERKEINAFDINGKYYSYITEYLKKDQLLLRKRGARMFSILTVEEGSETTAEPFADAVFIRSKNRNADLREKASAIAKEVQKL